MHLHILCMGTGRAPDAIVAAQISQQPESLSTAGCAAQQLEGVAQDVAPVAAFLPKRQAT